ncbi:arylsulfotransferase family protein [Halomicrococcus sp. SG-WS-1]|uniref:arylsulfotransferase family protein n=1 Tax=Halomicrococcus sp. SG-WS-1 TaxID=3439057 RepID=UPI003F78B2BC
MDLKEKLPSQPWLVRGTVLLLVVALLAPSAVSALTYDQEESNLEPGTMEKSANGTTVISVQGYHFEGQGNNKKPARLVAVGPRGDVKWVHNGSKEGATWFYDVDPMENGNLLVTSTQRGKTLVYEFDPETKEKVWTQELDIEDTHDVDLINGNQLLVANMKNYDEDSGKNDDSIFVYDLEKDEIVWRWYFRSHYDRDAGKGQGKYTDDWTHVNDVEKIGPGKYMADPRNMDEVIVVDRESKEVTMKLGEDGNYDVLRKQHNPDYLESEDGNPTVLVADSHNQRVVEYERENGKWNQTWSVGSHETFNWPRDADRLPNGNTLVVDSQNHRVVEVTPKGEVVWEFYSPWLPYDVERVKYGDESNGSTMSDVGVTGEYDVTGSANLEPGGDRIKMSVFLSNTFAGTPFQEEMQRLGETWDQATPFIRPIWMDEYAFIAAILAGLLLVGWVFGEGVYHRRRIYHGIRKRLA